MKLSSIIRNCSLSFRKKKQESRALSCFLCYNRLCLNYRKDNIVILKKFKKKKTQESAKKPEKEVVQTDKKTESTKLIRHSDFFSRVKPKNKYCFFSDYFMIDDDTYGTVLTLLHNDGADNRLPRFWGVLVSVMNWLDTEEFRDVRIRFLNQARKRPKGWVDAKQLQSERVVASDKQEAKGFSTNDKATVNENEAALTEVMEEIRKGASYLDVRMNYLIKAPSLEILDTVVRRLNKHLRSSFDTLTAKAFDGAQRQKLNMLLRSTVMKDERQFGFTSEEYAGFYNLVTHGIEDLTGEYVGQMRGDINASAVLLDIDKYRHHLVVASGREARTRSYLREDLSPFKPLKGSDLWGVKIGQVALMNRHRVVHFVLNNADIASVGLDLSPLTAVVDMDDGALNPFEAFGDPRDELTIFPALLEKIKLMTLMMSGGDESEKNRIRNELTDILTMFYVDRKMWPDDTSKAVNRESIRLVGLPHDEYPRLPEFAAYLRQEYDKLANGESNEPTVQETLRSLRAVFNDMLKVNGSLFDTITSSRIDDADHDSRVIYDFSSTLERGRGVAMAQFVNVLSYAVRSLGSGDVVIIHGAENINSELKKYITEQFDILFNKGVRVVYCYGSIEKALDDASFNNLDEADYTLFGRMSLSDIDQYKEIIKQDIPSNLNEYITADRDETWYIRRTFENVVFDCDFGIGLSVQGGHS